jgi:DNA-binding NtrC family response regulator
LKSAHGGTLVLENVVDWDLEMQRTLGDALSANEVARAAGRASVDARLVTTTDVTFSEAVAMGRIEATLAEHLGGVVIELPALRARVADIPALFMRLLSHYSGASHVEVTARVVERLCLYTWPRNVEELQTLARQVASTRGSRRVVGRSDLPAELFGTPAPKRSKR